MIEKNFTAAVEAYKNALINDPADDESRYNFALAKKMLKDNPPPKEDKEKEKEDKKKEEKEKQDQDKKDQDKKDQDKKDGKDQDEKSNPEKPADQGEPKPKSGISKQRIENMLDAVGNEEKKIQEKMIKGKERGKPVRVEKDW